MKKVADIIKNTQKRAGDFCARYGGEEFIIVLPNTDLNGAIKIAKEIQEKLKNLNIKHNSSEIGNVSLSIGITSIYDYNVGIEEDKIIKEADEALYKAKENGRNRIEVYEKQNC